ncbi:hypothetical protein CNX65_13910 [Actinosynnema pretiosum]|uniref:Uncharacterized protein n=1 Tax=Actinosynnema pretiosum TaxID=42197 RepID=A0A290Z5F2_9PSEU|nr:hypothetical protein CNX65_13910 [Actinosynnema pretiosum]
MLGGPAREWRGGGRVTSAVTATDLALFCWPLGVDEHDGADVPVVPRPRRPSPARGERREDERATPVSAG